MNPFNAWPDRLWIGKLTTCDVCYKDRIRAAMIIGNLDYDVDRVLCRDCVDTVLLALRINASGLDLSALI